MVNLKMCEYWINRKLVLLRYFKVVYIFDKPSVVIKVAVGVVRLALGEVTLHPTGIISGDDLMQ